MMRVSYGNMMPETAPAGTGHVAAPNPSRAHSARETIRCGCMMASDGSGKNCLELIEQLVPALRMVVARGLVEELLVGEDHQGACAVGLDRHPDQRFPLGRRVPGPGEHQSLVRHHLAIDAA